MNKYSESLRVFLEDDPGEKRLKTAQEISENFETIVSSTWYSQFLEQAVPTFIKFLQDGEPFFVSEFQAQQTRKAVLELLHRFPCNDHLRPHVKPILNAVFRLLTVDNEENVLICLRIIIELHKQFRPPFSTDVQTFLHFVRSVYKELPKHMEKIFEPKIQFKVKEINEINLSTSAILDEIYTVTNVLSEKRTPEGGSQSYTVLPKAKNSLKVLQELPIIVVLMYQIYKTSVQQEVADFIPIVMSTITLQPTDTQRFSPGFNKETLVEFMGAQVKTLSFLAYIIKLYQELVIQHSDLLVNGLINLLTLCPMEVAVSRREVFIAARHLMATELRYKFIPYIDKLFDEEILLGRGWTVNETMRPLAYSTLADLVHHVRQQLSLVELNKAVTFFSYHIHDETLPLSIQTMSCKLLFNLVESIRMRSESDGGNGREILMKMLEVLVYKFKIVVQVHIPYFTAKFNILANAQSDKKPDAEQSADEILSRGLSTSDGGNKDETKRFGFPSTPMQNYVFHECRTLVKTIVCAIKTIAWGIAACKVKGPNGELLPGTGAASKQFNAKETEVYLRLLKWGMKAIDIYAITGPVTNVNGQTVFIAQRPINNQGVRSKEEKEVLEHFAGAFTMLNTYTFRELFSVRVKELVERIYENSALQVVANNLLANPSTSAVFATILVEFLLEKMPEMGDDVEKSGLYLRLFKLVFGSVSLFPAENEQMLKPHLREIVNRSMELALNAKDPYNYFLLLRALFRSIGGGSHDLLYQEFLPLLPSLLQGLNSLQSGLHKQHMKDLFVELCLTVPVRLSSLLPYLPMLMDPLVSALNGSPTLVSQGLRTLELCVDNLQPDFLYEHIQPVRAELMQALWRTLRNTNEGTATTAFRILGKFGGSNRKMLVEPQKLEYSDKTNLGPQVLLYFIDHKAPVSFPVEKAIETAYNILKSQTAELTYKKNACGLLKSYIVASMVINEDQGIVNKVLLHNSLQSQEITNTPLYKYSDDKSRLVHSMAFSGILIASTVKEMKREVYSFLIPVVRHYGMIAVAQQIGPFASKYHGMDPYIIFDAISTVLGSEEKDYEKPVFFCLSILMNLLINLVGTKERACALQMMEYLSEKICTLCYERAWYTKMGGCNAISFLLDHMSHKWILSHHVNILKAMVFVLTDLTGEVASGAVDAAKANLEKALRICVNVEDTHLQTLKQKSLDDATLEFVRFLTSCVTNVREQSTKNLGLLAELQGKTLSEIIKPHIGVLGDMIPPKKHLIRHQSLQAQLGILDGNSFCLSLSPKLFGIDFTLQEHRSFTSEIIQLSESDDINLAKLPCYKNVTNLVPVRIAMLRVLACIAVPPTIKEKVVGIFLKALSSTNAQLQEAAFECMKKFMEENAIDPEMVKSDNVKAKIASLTTMKSVTLEGLREAAYIYQLTPDTPSSMKMWETLLQVLRRFLECALVNHSKQPSRSGAHELKIAVAIINHFEIVTSAPQAPRFVEPLAKLCIQAEKALLLGKGCPLRPPLLKFLVKVPTEYINFVFGSYLNQAEWNRCFIYFLQQSEATNLREKLTERSDKIVHCLKIKELATSGLVNYTQAEQNDIQYLGVKCAWILNNFDENWIVNQTEVFQALKTLWENPEYHKVVQVSNGKLDVQIWSEPRLLAKLLLSKFKRNTDDIDLLFSLLLAFCGRCISQYQFLKDFLENTVTPNFPIPWKRQAFFRFVELFENQSYPSELKAKIIQYVLIPCMSNCFEKGIGDEFIGSAPMPDADSPDNIVSVILTRVIDPENPNGQPDHVRILLCQLACLLVEVASAHIHDASNKKQGNKLRRLMTFAWPCLLSKTCVDSSTKYYGHLLLSHIIAKFAIHKRIVLQVFHSLLKASALEAKAVIKQALEIITPALPLRMEDGNTMLIHWTKKILVEEGHSLSQLMHILQLIVRHWKVYYPVRHHLIKHMGGAIQRLGFSPASTVDHRKLAVELAEVIIKWDLERMKSEGEDVVSQSGKVEPSPGKNLDRGDTDAVVNFLLRMACQVNDPSPTPGQPGEMLSRRCVTLVKTVLKPDVWTGCELKLAWFDKLFSTLETPQVNQLNICTALELLTFITGILTKEQLLEQFKGLQKGIALCMSSQNTKIIRAVHNLMTKLMSIFPTEFNAGASSSQKTEELDQLYGHVSKMIYDALSNYEKITAPNPSSLHGPLMIMKSACTANPCYIDRIITSFMKVLQKLAKEHLSAATPENQTMGTELLLISMDLVKNRVGVMGVEMRKAFIGTILVSLIEKTTEVKVMQGIIKMLEEWVKNKTPIVINQGPSSREKSILLVKLMQNVEKRFSSEPDLVCQYLELINFIYRDDHLRSTELTTKLEQAFLSGLRCSQPSIRKKFFEVFDGSVRRRLHDRLMYILCSQNWESMGSHYWIKQCIELLLSTVADVDLQVIPQDTILPGIAHAFNALEDSDKATFMNYPEVKEELMDDTNTDSPTLETEIDLLTTLDDADPQVVSDLLTRVEEGFFTSWNDPEAPVRNVRKILLKQQEFNNSVQNTKLTNFIGSLVQLCHLEIGLAEKVWISFFPRAWKVFTEKQQMALANELVPFLCSGVHVIQRDCVPSALNTFTEALCQCIPSIAITPVVLFYLGKTHNLWHRMALSLEQLAIDGASPLQIKAKKDQSDCYEFEPGTSAAPSSSTSTGSAGQSQSSEVMDSLSELYASLKEEDLWSGLWQKKAKYIETNIGISFELQGFYEKAQGAFELAMGKAKTDYAEESFPANMCSEFKLWEQHWMKCARELCQWDILQEYGYTKAAANPALVVDSIWRQGNWSALKEALSELETSCPKEMTWKVHLYRGYIAICSTDDQNLQIIDRYVENATQVCIKDWRRLPHVVTNAHIPILQAAQQIVELNEATQIHQGFVQSRANTVHDMKAVVKTWRNRLPCISDDLSHWCDIFTWRRLHYQFISNNFDVQDQNAGGGQTMVGVHASAQAICHFGKIARKHDLSTLALDYLNKIYSIPSVPIVDCFQKIKQQVKCYIQQAQLLGRTDLQEALELVESTNLKYFSKEMTAEFFTLKAVLLSQIGRSDEANKAFSAAVQLNDNSTRAWGVWGDYLEYNFSREPKNMSFGIAAVTSFMQSCRHQNETKARKYIAKIIWLLTYDDEKSTLAEVVDKYSSYVPPIQWLPWVPQLLNLLVRHDAKMIINLLNAVGRMYPQAVYFPIRTLYLTLKIEQREKVRNAEMAAAAAAPTPSAQGDGDQEGAVSSSQNAVATQQQQPGETQAIKATPSMWRCSRIMHMQRDLHPTVLSSLEGIVDQIVWFRENWYEEVLRQLKIGLAKCYAIAFENRATVLEASITPQLQNFVRKLVSTFGHASAAAGSGATTMEALLRSRSSIQDPSFQQMKLQFTVDFDTAAPGALKLHNLILRLRKWIKILEVKTKLFAKSFLMEDRFRFLQSFSTSMAEIELPGEFLIPKHVHYYVKIARFQPRVEVVQKHNTSARRIFIRGHNGKIYPYLIVNDSGLTDARREERVMQMMRMMNHYLGRQKITARRNLKFTVPKVVAVSPQMRLVEDNPSSLSLLDVFKHSCSKRSIEYDSAICRYYEKIAAIQTRGAQVSHQVLREILRDIQANIVPRTMMKEWALNTFSTPTDYWMFRKMFTLQLCLTDFAEYAFHLTRLNPEMMYLHQDSGMVNISYFKFELDDVTGELESNRPVYFRLTPNITEFITPFGVSGPVVSSMISISRCLVYPNYKLQAILRAILRDEMIAWLMKKQNDREILNAVSGSKEQIPAEVDSETVINMVTKAVNAMMNRLQLLSSFDGIDSKVNTLVSAATSHDNLCRMDPAWHPWL